MSASVSEVKFKVLRSRRRTISISVNRNEITVKAPHHASDDVIRGFVRENSEWIEKRLSEALEASRRIGDQELFTKNLPYLGQIYPIYFSDTFSRERILFEGNRFTAHVRSRSQKNLERLHAAWLRRRARQIFADRVAAFSHVIGASPSRITIRNQRTRWGSATASTGTLSFNYNILKAPADIVDYIVVHELSHLVEPNHSRSFWKIVESVIPDYKEKVRWLKKNGMSIMGFTDQDESGSD